MACNFLAKWPTLEDLKRAKTDTLRKFFYGHNCRREDRIQERLESIEAAEPLTRDRAIISSSVITDSSIMEYDQRLADCFALHPDAEIFESFPGAGTALAPRLLSAFGSDRDRYEHAGEIQTYSGIAPVKEESGKYCWIHWRWACPKFLRQTFHEHAKCSIPVSVWAKAYYEM